MRRARQATVDGRSVPAYPLRVEGWSDDGDGYWSAGHHDPEAFVTAIETEYEGETAPAEEHAERVARVRHEWFRYIPAPRWAEEDGRYINAVPHSRGAFPVTVIYE